MASPVFGHKDMIVKQENLTSSDNSSFEGLPDEILLKILSYFDIREIVNMGKTSSRFYEITEEPSLWDQIGFYVGINNIAGEDSKEQLKHLDSMALIHHLKESGDNQKDDVPRIKKHIPNRNTVTTKTLKENLSIIKCNDFLRVWENIIYSSSSDLSLPTDAKTLQDPNHLDEMFGSWIERNKTILDSLNYLCLASLGLTFLPTSITKLSYLKEIDLSYNWFSYLPESFGDLSRLSYIDLSNNKRLLFLPESLCKLTELHELILKGNNLKSLPENLDNFNKSNLS